MSETMNSRVAILGNGPSAAYAYRACVDNGITPHVYASRKPSHPTGAFWLHWLPPSLPPEQVETYRYEVVLLGLGSSEIYSGKMWGETFKTSFPSHSRIETAYDPAALDLLWGGFNDWQEAGILRDAGIEQLAAQYDLVLQTFPSDAARSQQRPPVFFPVLSRPIPSGRKVYCFYNGTPDEWVRMTIGFGWIHVEFPPDWLQHPVHWPTNLWTTFKFPDTHPSTQPITIGVAPNIVMLGRHARWDRRLLSDSAYEMTVAALQKERD